MAGEDDVAEAAEQISVMRTVRRGRDAWEEIGKAESFESWESIGAALAIGKTHALRVTGANRAWGSTYSKAFSKWVADHGFTSMRPSDRSYAIALHENLAAISSWRDGLSAHRRNRLIGAQANVKGWKAATAQGNAKCPRDLKRDAAAAWRRFISCMNLLPPDEAILMWQVLSAEMPTSHTRTHAYISVGTAVGMATPPE
jgi:hypothetical protein